MRVLVCGGRNYIDRERVHEVLDQLKDITLLIEGGARGADALGFEWATRKGVPTQTFTADWKKHGRKAGPIRNKKMLREGQPDLLVAFPGGSGTRHMVEIAKKAGVTIWKIDH